MNEVDRDAVEKAIYRPEFLKRWQRHLLSRFPREDYVSIPEPWINMWRHATWERFVSDTVSCNGTQMATILSMVYKP